MLHARWGIALLLSVSMAHAGNPTPLTRVALVKAASSTPLEALRAAERTGAARLVALLHSDASVDGRRAYLKLLRVAPDGWSAIIEAIDLALASVDTSLRQEALETVQKLFARLSPEQAELDDIPADFVAQCALRLAAATKNSSLEARERALLVETLAYFERRWPSPNFQNDATWQALLHDKDTVVRSAALDSIWGLREIQLLPELLKTAASNDSELALRTWCRARKGGATTENLTALAMQAELERFLAANPASASQTEWNRCRADAGTVKSSGDHSTSVRSVR